MSETIGMWLVFVSPNGVTDHIPAWQRTVGFANGTYWVPGGLFGHERTLAMCALYDGEPMAIEDDHYYFRREWLSKEVPDASDYIDTLLELVGPLFSRMSANN